MRERYTAVTGVAAAMSQANINTDAIIPAAYLRTARADLGKGLFGAWRYDEDGRERPDFVLNREPFRHAKVLFAGENFGCGSSREAAAWALLQFGFRCVFAPSFADIFYENAFRNGLLAGVVDPGMVTEAEEAIAADADRVFAVDLPRGLVTFPDGAARHFSVPASRSDALICGDDEIDATMRQADDIATYLLAAKREWPWLYHGVGRGAQ